MSWRSDHRYVASALQANPFDTGEPRDPLGATLFPGEAGTHPFGIVVNHGGPARIFADIGPPVNVEISFPVFSYISTSVGCFYHSDSGLSFDTGDAKEVDTPSGSDLYVTGPFDDAVRSEDACQRGFRTTDRAYVLNAPFGATIVSGALPAISLKAWHAEFRQLRLPAKEGVLLFKTRAGRVVKMQITNDGKGIVGFYLVSSGSEFADVASRDRNVRIETLMDYEH